MGCLREPGTDIYLVLCHALPFETDTSTLQQVQSPTFIHFHLMQAWLWQCKVLKTHSSGGNLLFVEGCVLSAYDIEIL